jgi:hypothetical protein
MRYIFDIETAPLPSPELESLIPPFDPNEVKCGNIKDPEKIKAKIAESEASHKDDFIKRAALSAITGRVLAVGIRNGEAFDIVHGSDEISILRHFWEVYENNHLHGFAGFNIFGFDLPFMVRRSWKLGVTIPASVREGRYWGRFFHDLMDAWCLGNREQRASLDSICKHLGIGCKSGSGADFAALYETDQKAALAYLENDLLLTAKLAAVLL